MPIYYKKTKWNWIKIAKLTKNWINRKKLTKNCPKNEFLSYKEKIKLLWLKKVNLIKKKFPKNKKFGKKKTFKGLKKMIKGKPFIKTELLK